MRTNGILSQPIRPGLFRTCPACGKHLALEFQRREPHELLGYVDHYRCRHCDHAVEFAERLPRQAV